jgi:hypothetical protein
MKRLELHSKDQVRDYIAKLRDSAHLSQMRIQDISETRNDLDFLERIKFEPIGLDPLDTQRPLNLIEQINQTFTYLASFKAAEILFQQHRKLPSLVLNLGTTSGSDIESEFNGGIAAEVFAATKPSSNQKLKKDIAKVHATGAAFQYVFFMCPSIKSGPYPVKDEHVVQVWSLGA